jgi:hypothetical protein
MLLLFATDDVFLRSNLLIIAINVVWDVKALGVLFLIGADVLI